MGSGNRPKLLDLFSGAGGLAEGFIRAGFEPIAHIEMDPAACYTLKTRMSYHWLKNTDNLNVYIDYITGNISREEFYSRIPKKVINTVLNYEISDVNLPIIFKAIDSLLEDQKLDIIIGGPPCQAYSLVGRSRLKGAVKFDKRNNLYILYAEFLKRYQPQYFLFENVAGLLSAKDNYGNLYYDKMIKLFTECGYHIEENILQANDYGVLQNRKRVFLVGARTKKSGFFPRPDNWNPQVKVSEVLNDLPPLKAGEGSIKPSKALHYNGKYLYESGIKNDIIPITFHTARSHSEQDKEIYHLVVDLWMKEKKRLDYNDLPDRLKTHRNRVSFIDRFKVVANDIPYCHTIVAHLAKDGHYYIHPDINQNRSLTPREAARFQSFPDDYFFESNSEIPGRTQAFKQIGNAVPVLLAQKIADQMKRIM
ncbi:MAG: DNA cytosine methyltransferase [Brevinematales bacterium]|nr:DNA cytosine methyltransferase [Brevinematales bacterium]